MKKLLILMLAIMLLVPVAAGLLTHRKFSAPRQTDTKKTNVAYLETGTNTIKKCNLEEYLVGVLAAEMPANYHKEALKAQSVAARSFVVSRLSCTNPDHPGAAVCDDPNHCKAYLDENSAKEGWSTNLAEQYWQKLEEAVLETAGEYMICEDKVVEAFFFARSSGRTENSEDVWGEPRPYLKSVESAGDKEHPELESSEEFDIRDARGRLNNLNKGIKINNTPLKIGASTRTEGGSIAEINLDGIAFRGKDIRSAFGLKSADFVAEQRGDKFIFRVFGYGHGVGMSQYGANCMAEKGKNYTEILKHYYTNIQIIK